MSKDSGTGTRWRFGMAEFDDAGLELRVSGKLVELAPKPLEVLAMLLRHAGEVVTKEELLDDVWGGAIVGDTVIPRAVSLLRVALRDVDGSIVRTVHRYGYRLAVAVLKDVARSDAGPDRFDLKPGDSPPGREPWKLVEKLGAGGHGDVWLALHEQTGESRVFKFALEGGPLGGLKREITLNRLLRETLGPDGPFVHVLDRNLLLAPYFIELEYLAGRSLKHWTQAQGGLRTMPLDVRLDLLAQTADALAQAHSIGVLHKDVKPGNILMTAAGRVRLCDFGSGGFADIEQLKALNFTRLGFTGTLPSKTSGTWLYLAPEVIAGHPSTIRSDIYALGILLYQFIVADFDKPLAPGWEAEIDDELLREDIASAVAGDPARRLADAGQLAARIRALPARREQRAVEQARRWRAMEQQRVAERWRARRVWVIASIVLLVSGLVASLFLYRRAEANAADAREQANTAQATEDFLLKIFFADDRSRAQDPPVQELSAKALLDGNIDRIATILAQQPAVQLRLLKAARTIYLQWNDQKRLLSATSRIVDLTEHLYGSGDPRTLDEMLLRVDPEVTLGELDTAKATVDEVERRIVANHLEDTVVHAHLLYFRSSLDMAPDRDLERATLLARAISILSRLKVEDDPLYIIMQNDWATALGNQGRMEESRTHFQEAIRAATAMPTEKRDDGILGALYGNLASLDLWLGDVDGAESAFSHGQDLIDKTYGETYPDGWTAQALYAEFVHRRGDRTRALEMFAEVLKRIEGENRDVVIVAGVRQRYANCLIAEGRPAEAIPLLQTVVPVLRDILQSEHRLTAVQMLLGQAYGASGNVPEARAMLKLAHDKGPEGSHDLEAWMTVRRRWAQQLIRDGDPAAAQTELETLLGEAKGPDVPIVALAQSDLARLVLAGGDIAEARDLSEKSMATLSRVQAFHDVRIEPELWRVQAQVLAQSGDTQGAAKWCARALEASRKYDDPDSPTVKTPCPLR